MKRKDYKRLAKISLKARKKTTRSTVRGISFGLILLMPLLFIVIAFHLDLNKEVNKDPSIRVFNIDYSNEDVKEGYSITTMKEEKLDKISEIKGVENIIKYNQYTFTNSMTQWDESINNMKKLSPFEVVIGDKTFSLDYDLGTTEDYRSDEVGITVIDKDYGNSIFLKADYSVSNSPLYAGKEFSSNSAKEIMISSNILKYYNLTVEDVLNKNITINYVLQSSYDTTTSLTEANNTSIQPFEGIPVSILKDYKIIGVFDSSIYKTEVRMNTQKSYMSKEDKYETYFWITTDSVLGVNDSSYIPEIIRIEVETEDGYSYQRTLYYYKDTPVNLSKSAKANGLAFIPLGMGVRNGDNGDSIISFKTLVEFESYGAANNAVSVVNGLYEEGATGTEDQSVTTSYMQDTFMNYRMFYNVFTYACIVLAIFGGVIFFATLLNLYNTIHYSVQSRRNYLGMIRAIGMKGKEVTKMYFVEVFQIFKRSYIWTAIFGGGICYGITLLFKMIMESDAAAILTINLSLNPIYILVAFGALIIVNTLISLMFALIACHNVSKKPILEVLVENR